MSGRQAPSPEARTYAADLLGRLAERATDELDCGQLPIDDGDRTLPVLTLDQVTTWIDGLATRVRAGSDL